MSRRAKGSVLPARPAQGRLIAGVCTAIGEWLALDVTLVRLAFLVLALAWGLGVLLYGILWALMPEPDSSSALGSGGTFRRTARGMRVDLSHARKGLSASWQRAGREPWPRPLGRRWLAIGLVVAGASIFLASVGAFDWLNGPRAFGLAIIALGVSLIVAMRNRE
ncbi:MAG: PspC domain-containing protein [Polyangia bacterium]